MDTNNFNRVLILLLSFLILSCNKVELKEKKNIAEEKLTIEILEKFLGSKISEKINFNNFLSKDTILESEGMNWPGKIFSKNNTVSFLFETNWIDTTLISRITIFDPSLKYLNEIGVSKFFKEIKPFVNEEIPSVPDGYLLLRDKYNNKLSYELEIDKYPDLFYGVTDIKAIPDSLKIKKIIIMEN